MFVVKAATVLVLLGALWMGWSAHRGDRGNTLPSAEHLVSSLLSSQVAECERQLQRASDQELAKATERALQSYRRALHSCSEASLPNQVRFTLLRVSLLQAHVNNNYEMALTLLSKVGKERRHRCTCIRHSVGVMAKR
jgi:hypothetical protein